MLWKLFESTLCTKIEAKRNKNRDARFFIDLRPLTRAVKRAGVGVGAIRSEELETHEAPQDRRKTESVRDMIEAEQPKKADNAQ